MGIKTALVVAGILAATQTASPQAAQQQQPGRTEQQPPAVQMTVPKAQQPQQQQPGRQRPAEQPRSSDQRHEPAPEEKTSVTHHSAHIGGQQISYTATAATYVIRADDGS